jgi:hypothetical protein
MRKKALNPGGDGKGRKKGGEGQVVVFPVHVSREGFVCQVRWVERDLGAKARWCAESKNRTPGGHKSSLWLSPAARSPAWAPHPLLSP